jgi:hypothetical protein
MMSATGGVTTGGDVEAVLPPPPPQATNANKLKLQILRKTIPNLPRVEALPDQCKEKLPVAAPVLLPAHCQLKVATLAAGKV